MRQLICRIKISNEKGCEPSFGLAAFFLHALNIRVDATGCNLVR